MSNAALTWAFEAEIPHGPKFVLVVLGDAGSDHAGEDWTCFPSIPVIARKTGYTRRSVERHLDWLWRQGWISRKRRRRADGSLGIYDWTLHRDVERREELAEARTPCAAGVCDDAPDDKMSCGELFPPHDIDDTGHTTKTTRPHDKMSWQEPSRNPQEEPSPRASEAVAPQKDLVGFDQVVGAYPLDGQARTDWPMARAAFARACELVTADQLLAAVARYAAEGRFGDFGPPAFERWLQREGWRPWLSEVGAEARPSLAVVRQWGGPVELRAAIVADPVLGEAWARSYLDGASWFGAERLIVPASHFAGGKLRREAGGHLRTYEISVGGPDRPAASGGL